MTKVKINNASISIKSLKEHVTIPFQSLSLRSDKETFITLISGRDMITIKKFESDTYATIKDLYDFLITKAGSTGGSTQIINSNGDPINSFGSASADAEFKSPYDFSVSYTSAEQISVSGFTVNNPLQIKYIIVKDGNTSKLYINNDSNVVFDYTDGVISIYKNGDIVPAFSDTSEIEVGIDAQTKAFDPSTNSSMTWELNKSPIILPDSEPLIEGFTAADESRLAIVPPSDYPKLAIQINATNDSAADISVSIYITLDADAADNSVSDITVDNGWIDKTTALFEAPIASDSINVLYYLEGIGEKIAIIVTHPATGNSVTDIIIKRAS